MSTRTHRRTQQRLDKINKTRRLRRRPGALKYRTYAPYRNCGRTDKQIQSVNRGLNLSPLFIRGSPPVWVPTRPTNPPIPQYCQSAYIRGYPVLLSVTSRNRIETQPIESIEDIPKNDFPVLARIRGLFIGLWRTARCLLNTGKWAYRGRRCRCRYAVEIDRISSHTFL